MINFKLLPLLLMVISLSTEAEITKSSDDDVLSLVNQKLINLEKYFQEQKVDVSTSVIDWDQLETFKSELMFVAAHDPNGPQLKDTPAQLVPSSLTQRLKQEWEKLEISALSIGDLAKSSFWAIFKLEVEEYIQLREKYFYQMARNKLRTGSLLDQISKVEEIYKKEMIQLHGGRNLTVKVVDPYVEKMAFEVGALHKSLLQLKEFRTPPKKENTSIFQPKHQVELGLLALASFGCSAILLSLILWLKKKIALKSLEKTPVKNSNAFNYYDWLKKMESSLQGIKDHEENLNEDFIKLKEFTEGLGSARKKLNEAVSQQEYYISLDQLNGTALKIEEYFSKMNLKKNGEATRKLVSHMINLCEAIESKKEFSFLDEKPKLLLMKLPKGSNSKAA
jgi:hypothetical protein